MREQIKFVAVDEVVNRIDESKEIEDWLEKPEADAATHLNLFANKLFRVSIPFRRCS